MKQKVVAGIVLMFLISTLSSAFNVQPVKATSTILSVVKTKILEPGDDLIHGFVYYKGYLWASTRTSPCRILKIDPETLDYERIVLDADLDDGEDLIVADGYIWVILYTSPSKIVRVNPETLVWEVAISFQNNELSYGGSLEYAFGYLWAGGRNGKIAKIDLSDLTYEIYDYSTVVGNSQFHALTSGGEYIWGSCPHYSWLEGWYADTIVRINPSNPTDYTLIYIKARMCDDMAYVGGYLYTGSEKSPSYVYKISNNLIYSDAKASDTKCYGIFAHNGSIWGAYVGSPGKIIEFDANLNIKTTYQLPVGFNDANEIAFDTAGNMYVTCWESPAKIVKLSPRGNQPPTCSIRLQKNGVEINKINVGEFFDIYVGGSTDDTGIVQVRFSSDDSQDGVPTGEWTEWYNWSVSSEDWNASTKIKRWAFATPGYKEVWAEVKDDIGQTTRCSVDIYAIGPPPQLTFTKLEPSQIETNESTYRARLEASGTNFLNVVQIKWSWSGLESGTSTWNKGDSNWNNYVEVISDTSMILKPMVLYNETGTQTKTWTWTVTLKDSTGATASRQFTVTYKPTPTLSTSIMDLWIVGVPSEYESYPQWELFVVPANEKVSLKYLGILKDEGGKPIRGKEVKLFIDGKLVSSCITTAESYNVNGILTAEFSYGMHNGELRFEGDGEYQGSSYSFTLVAYKGSGFNITKDAYSFANWRYSLEEHGKLVSKLLEEELIESEMQLPLLSVYPILAIGGHCFGMAASSAVYYVDPSRKPKDIDVYEMSKDDPDVLWNIDWYHLRQIQWFYEQEISKSMGRVKSLIDSGTPVILCLRLGERRHAVTVIGYYEGEGETLLIVYNNNFPNKIEIYSVKDGKLMIKGSSITKVTPVDPHDLSKPTIRKVMEDILRSLFSLFSGILIHSPVDVNITSGSGRQLVVVNNTVVRNDFAESYSYVSEDYKIIMLPSNESYRVELTGTGQGEVHIEFVYKSDKGITTDMFQSITVNSGSKIHIPSLQSQVAYVDLNGDGSIDREVRAEVVEVKAEVAPEPIPNAALILALLVTSALIIVVLLKKKMKTKIPPPPPPPPPPS